MGRKVAVITGSSAGLGRAIAVEFAKNDYAVALLSRNKEALEQVRSEIVAQYGVEATTIAIDVSDPDAVENAAATIEQDLGPIDVWVNNAMCSVFSPAAEMTPAEYKRVTEVTYLGYVYGTLSALHRMKPRNSGTIVQVGSALAHRAIPLQSAYCAAKHAIKGFTESLISELIHDGSEVKVSMVQMPALNTPQFRWVKSRLPRQAQPVPPIFQPEVGARAVFWASQHTPRELLVGYPTMKAVFGENVSPTYIDKYLAETGYDSQQTDEPASKDAINNLWQPAPIEYYTEHGDFDDASRNFAATLTYAQMLGIALTSAASIGCTAFAIARGIRRMTRKSNGAERPAA